MNYAYKNLELTLLKRELLEYLYLTVLTSYGVINFFCPTSVMSGVPQGTILAPLLFLCYINDLPENLSSKVRLYADDVLLYKTIHYYYYYQIQCKTINVLEMI